MKHLHTLLFTSLAALSLLCSCTTEAIPDDVIDEETMASFLQEAYTIEGFYAVETEFLYDTLQPQMEASYDSLLAERGLTREDFNRSVRWYCSHPEINLRIHDTVVARLDTLLAATAE